MHSTDNLEDNYLGSGKRLIHSVNKYGKENHKVEILEFLDSRKELIRREIELVNESLLQDPMCMNLKLGGDGGLGFISDEQQLRRSKAGAKASVKSRRDNLEIAEKMRNVASKEMTRRHKAGEVKYDTFTGKTHTEDSKRKIGIANSKYTGKKNSQFGTKWINNGIICKKNSKDEQLPDGWKFGRIKKNKK